MPPVEDFTIGVEEEYQILHPETRELRQRAARILPEARQRLGQILKKLRGRAVRGEKLAALRGVEVLEHLGTAPARQVLQSLAEGAAGCG